MMMGLGAIDVYFNYRSHVAVDSASGSGTDCMALYVAGERNHAEA
jgi:hypothetical protein